MPSAFVSFHLGHNAALSRLQQGIQSQIGPAQYQNPATFHMTAVYCTDIDDAALRAIIRKARRLDLQPFTVTASSFGLFENGDERALYLDIDPSGALSSAQSQLYDLFIEAGFEDALSPYSNPADYRPHATMAYLQPGQPIPDLTVDFSAQIARIDFGRDRYVTFDSIKVKPMSTKTRQRRKGAETENEKAFQPFTQDEANYQPYQASGSGCGNCRFFMPGYGWDGEDGCRIIEDWPEPILPTGLCSQWTARQGQAAEAEPVPVTIVDDETKSTIKDIFGRVFDAVIGRKAVMDARGFKMIGDNRWLAWWTNNFEDRQKELFAEHAIDDYIDRVKSGAVPYPELWYWHVPGTKHGQADHVWRVGHFAVATGTIDDTPIAQKFAAYYQAANDLGVSHGYLYPQSALVDGVYHAFTTFEISSLPDVAAANPFTSFERIKAMNISETTRKELSSILGDDMAAQVLAAAEQSGKALEETGTRFKSHYAVEDIEARQQIKSLDDKIEALSGKIDQLLSDKEAETPAQQPAQTQDAPGPHGEAIKALADNMAAMQKTLEGLTNLSAPASRNPLTQLNDNDALAKWLKEQQESQKNQTPMSLVEQLTLAQAWPVPPQAPASPPDAPGQS